MRALLILLLVLTAACARKGDPDRPEGAYTDDRPTATAPSQVDDPIRRGKRL
ncbi:MAG: hypothetical protein AAF192_13435 [Pseudomonadota bacterium]